MIGAVIGDIVGSVYEFCPIKTTDFELFSDKSRFTDDTVMTAAIMKGYMESLVTQKDLKSSVRDMMVTFGRTYPKVGYGMMFHNWVKSDNHSPYSSFGNGAAMRITAAAYLGKNISEVQSFSNIFTKITHDHVEALKAAQAVACAIYMARCKNTKQEIEEYIAENYYYFIKSIDLDAIRPYYNFHIECQYSVPEAIRCFLDANSFEETIRLAVSLGGDADTQAAIAGSIAGEYFGIPEDIQKKACTYLDDYLLKAITEFEDKFIKNKEDI